MEELREYIDGLTIIDTHEHLPDESERPKDTDFFSEYLRQYFNRDLCSAGVGAELREKLLDQSLPVEARWTMAEPYWNNCRYTGYGRALEIAVRGLYGIGGINAGTVREIDSRIKASLRQNHYDYVLKQKSNIKVSINDVFTHTNPELFRNVFHLRSYVMPQTREDLRLAGQVLGSAVCGFGDWLQSCEMFIRKAVEAGAAALKIALAYERPLYFARSNYHEAENAFNGMFAVLRIPDWLEQPVAVNREFEDYMMHYALGIIHKIGLPVQIHTGMHEGNGNVLSDSNPTLLSNLFLEYPDTNFDLFHIGYPYQHETGVLAKTFPNVFIDMCWAQMISPVACVRAMEEWVETVPLNKISAFGGDYEVIDAVYGHQVIARENVCRALWTKCEQGLFDVEEAKRIARLWFVENPERLFSL